MADDRRNIDSCNLSLVFVESQNHFSLSRNILMAVYGGSRGPAFGSQQCICFISYPYILHPQ